MSVPRLIPVLLLKHGLLVRSQQFTLHQAIGNPMSTILRLSNWNVDELILIDISENDFHDLRRDDLQQAFAGNSALDVLREVAKVCFMPLAFGGRVRTLADIEERLAAGADKCLINTQALRQPAFIDEAARRFGSQCIVLSIDVRRSPDGNLEVYGDHARESSTRRPDDWAREVAQRGAGEIFLNSIDRDGMGNGYDIDLIQRVSSAVDIPVIACGGVGNYEDFSRALTDGRAQACAAANIFHFFELSYPLAKKGIITSGIRMRPVTLGSRWCAREPHYDPVQRAKRLRRAETPLDRSRYEGHLQRPIRWCNRCLYPSVSAAPLEFNSDGVCTGCLMSDAKKQIPIEEWKRRRALLQEIIAAHPKRRSGHYDCVIPVSGGKDSYYQTHVIRNELGLRPLLVTYNANNWTPAGWENLHRMKEVFDVDHLIVSPSIALLKKLNRLGFLVMGDMNWHAHVGIMSVPMQIASLYRIPFVFYGEHGYLDLGGQFSMSDFPEVSYRDRLEHFARGFEWTWFVGIDGLTEQDMLPFRYPSDEEIYDLDLRGLFLGNYIYWEANEHALFVQQEYGFRVPEESFDRTYRRASNLDDMHENGAHDYLKFIKFGYGRCTDHACKDIRAGLMTREEGVRRVLAHDHLKSRDHQRWFDYTGMSEKTYDCVADTFRDPRVWRIENDQWVKTDIDGVERAYGSVHLS